MQSYTRGLILLLLLLVASPASAQVLSSPSTSAGDGKILAGTGVGQAAVMSSTPVGTEEGLVVRCIGCAGTGGTSSSYGAAFPATGTAAGFSDGTNMQGGRAVDTDTGAGTVYVQGINLLKRASGGPVEAGTSADPLRVDPTGTTTQPVSAASLPLPTGASTLGEQQTQTTSLQLIDDLPLAQGSTTSGQKGALAQGAVTTSAPTYTTAQTSPLSLTTGGLLRVAIEAGGGSGGTSSSFGSSFPATGTAIGGSDGTNMQGPRVFDADSGAGTQYVIGANLRSSASGGSTETFAAPAALADATANPTLTGIGSFNMCFNGTTWDRCVKASTGAGAVDANTQRTTHASDDPVTTSVQIIDDLRLAQGSTTSGQAGVLGQGAVTTSAPTYTTAQTSPLSLQTDGSLRTAVTNTVAITANSSVNVAQINGVTPLMGAGNTGTGSPRVTLATDQAALVGLGIYTEDVAETAGGNLVMSGTVRRDVAATSSNASGDNSTLNTDATGLLWTRALDPCDGTAKSAAPFSISTATTTQLVAASASNKLYVCSINLVTAAANNVALIEDDTAACASPTAGMAGGTTAATGWNFAANGGLTLGNGTGSVAMTAATNRYVCLATSAATQLSGTMMYALAP